MTEPTQEQVNAAEKWIEMVGYRLELLPSVPEIVARHANHVTAELQAKIDRLEVGMAEGSVDKSTAWDAVCAGNRKDKARIATLEAELATSQQHENDALIALSEAQNELAARDFVPITDVHMDGEPCPVGWWGNDKWHKEIATYDNRDNYWYVHGYILIAPTHAAAWPKPPAKEGK